jgi:tRNA-2-methylthio-N6-dimethylallyladenosine synthase
VAPEVKSQRVTALVEMQRRISSERNREYINRTLPVLVEGDAKKSRLQAMGKTDGHITVIWSKSDLPSRPGQVVSCSIYDASASTLYAKAPTFSDLHGPENEHSCTNSDQGVA